MEKPDYTYEFDIEYCCWKAVCGLRNTDRCGVTCPRYTKMHYLLGNSLLPKCWWVPKPFYVNEDSVDFDSHMSCVEIKKDILNFVKEGRQLLIYSRSSGTGKTHMSTRMLLAYFSKIWEDTPFKPRGLFIDSQKLLNDTKRFDSEYKDYIMANIATVDLVVWDDMGVEESLTVPQFDMLFSIINERELNGKANIFTTNKNPEELYKFFGEKLYSRIVRSATIIEFKSADNRGASV